LTSSLDGACREIAGKLLEISNPTREDLNLVKIEVCRAYNLVRLPSNSEILRYLRPEERVRLIDLLKRKAVRGISGITVIAVMTKPWPCPHGRCAYCPGGPSYGVPQSYTGREPATMRGIQAEFDPYIQVRNRIEQLTAIGHEVDKVEIIIMGGTFPATTTEYQEWFIKGCLDALATEPSKDLEHAKMIAETSKIRNVGITVETRPDWAKQSEADRMLSMGVTRAELGVQNPYDDIYDLVERGHTVQDVVEATRILKDSGLKIVYHMMPGLPGSDFQRDVESFNRIFNDADFKPDMIKIYPCLVLKGTKTYDWWREGRYSPYTTEEAVELIARVKETIPPWVRVMRVQRDIPSTLIDAGVRKSNLRQLVEQRLGKQRCRCVRCREVGHRVIKERIKPDRRNIQVQTLDYKASEGTEIFVSAEDPVNDILIGYLRLRIPSEKAHRPEIMRQNASIIRELHIYGPVVPVGTRLAEAWQHKGYGGILVAESERISGEQYGRRKMLVTSALGTKRYYMRLGYSRDGPYMSKMIK